MAASYANFCRFNRRIRCPAPNRCPLQASDFIRDLEAFLVCGRTPRSADWSPAGPCQTGKSSTIFEITKRDLLSMICDDIVHSDLPEFLTHGKILMTKARCRLWREMLGKWRRLVQTNEPHGTHGTR